MNLNGSLPVFYRTLATWNDSRSSPSNSASSFEYTDNMSNLRYYEPDFVAVAADGVHYLIETKGLEDVNVVNKDRAARLWCENASTLTGKPWAYMKVRQTEYNDLQPMALADLFVLRPQKGLLD